MEEEIELVFNTNFRSVFLILLSFPQIKLLHWNLWFIARNDTGCLVEMQNELKS